MFDTDAFVSRCLDAVRDPQPHLAVRDVLQAELRSPAQVAAALAPERAEIVRLHCSDELTILKVVWAPGMSFGPHNHRMWATIGIFSGGEDNAFYRRAGDTLTPSGGRSLRTGDVALLGDDVIHAVTNPTTEHAGAIHIYGGDFFATPRSEWRGDPAREEAYDVERTLRTFEAANDQAPQSG
jgi:predicted metal-dependent enzyme (double-stranded beta helix superfamily)